MFHFDDFEHLKEACVVLEKIKCLGITGKEGYILLSHCLVLASFYIFYCNYKLSNPSIVEYIYQKKYLCNVCKKTKNDIKKV